VFKPIHSVTLILKSFIDFFRKGNENSTVFIIQSVYMNWVYLGLAIILEVCGTISMKLSDGMTDIKYAVVMLLFYILSLSALSLALKKIEVGIAYAIWSGIGIVLITSIGIIFFKETLSLPKIVCILLILVGAIGLNLFGTSH